MSQNKLSLTLLVFFAIGVTGVTALLAVEHYFENQATTQLKEFIATKGPDASVTFGSVDYALLDRSITYTDLTITAQGEQTVMEELVVYDIDTEHEVPHYSSIAVKGMSMSADSSVAFAQSPLGMMGYKQLVGDYSLSYRYDEKDASLFISASNRIREFGQLEFNANLSEFFPANFEDNNPAALTTVKFLNADVTFTNENAVERSLGYIGADRGMNSEQAQAFLVEQLSTAAEGKDDFMGSTLRQLRDFIAQPEKLRINLKPDQPASVLDFMQVAQTDGWGLVPERFNIEVIAN